MTANGTRKASTVQINTRHALPYFSSSFFQGGSPISCSLTLILYMPYGITKASTVQKITMFAGKTPTMRFHILYTPLIWSFMFYLCSLSFALSVIPVCRTLTSAETSILAFEKYFFPFSQLSSIFFHAA